eukprot:gene5004-15241_t
MGEEEIEVRQDILRYMGGGIELTQRADIPKKTKEKCNRMLQLWQNYPGLRLRDVVMQWNAVVAGSLRTQQAAALLQDNVTNTLQAQGRGHVLQRCGFTLAESTPKAYLHAPPPFGLGMVHLGLDGAKTHLLSLMQLNHSPLAAFETIDKEINKALEENGMCTRIIVPQDGHWLENAEFRGSILEHTMTALKRLGTVLVRETGCCPGRGPILVQRDAKHGEGLPHAPEDGDGVCVVRPRATSGQGTAWMELWTVAGRTIPIVPIPAEHAAWLRKRKFHHMGDIVQVDAST